MIALRKELLTGILAVLAACQVQENEGEAVSSPSQSLDSAISMESSSSSLELVDTFPFDTNGHERYRAKLERIPADNPLQIELQANGYLGTLISLWSRSKFCYTGPIAGGQGYTATFYDRENGYVHQLINQNDTLILQKSDFIRELNSPYIQKYAPLRGKPGFYADNSVAIMRITTDSLYMWSKPYPTCWADQMLAEPAFAQKVDCSTIRIPSLDLVISQQGDTWTFPGETCVLPPKSEAQDSAACQVFGVQRNNFRACLLRNYNSTLEPALCDISKHDSFDTKENSDHICVNFKSPTYFTPRYGF